MNEIKGTSDGAAKRRDRINQLRVKSSGLMSEIGQEISQYRPMGQMTEMAQVLGLRPKRGVVVGTPLGCYVFAKGRAPDPTVVARWRGKYQEADRLRTEAAQTDFSISGPNTTIGNIRVLENGKRLEKEGLLDIKEAAFVNSLVKFWAENASADTGIIRKNGTIEVLNLNRNKLGER